jgi:hypothetical protein
MYRCISNITECCCVDGQIKSYTKCFYNSYSDRVNSYEKEDYTYKDGLLQATDTYTFLPDAQFLSHEKYTFEHDDEGYLKTYKVIEYANGIEKEDSCWKDHIFNITQKRRV